MVIDHLKKLAKSGRYLHLFGLGLSLSSCILRIFPRSSFSQEILEARLFLEYSKGNLAAAEDILIAFARHSNPPTTAITKYISRIINIGKARRVSELLKAGTLSEGNYALVHAAESRLVDDPVQALRVRSKLSLQAGVSTHTVGAGRSALLQLHDNASLATDGMAFFRAEPEHIDFKFLIAIAAAAESVEREDLFASAVGRIIADLMRVTNDEKLSIRYMADVVTAKLTLFDIEGAEAFLRQAFLVKRSKAQTLLSHVVGIKDEASAYLHAVSKARDHIYMRANGSSENSELPVVIFSAAAFRNNSIDYNGFRRELRFIFGQIIKFLDDKGIEYAVHGRIKTHGHIRLGRPFFSYHTISDSNFGLHFKEADRPSLFSFDNKGYAGWSCFSQRSAENVIDLSTVSSQEASAFFESERRRVIGGNISKYAQPPVDAAHSLPDKYIFVATQVLGDAVSSISFLSQFQMLDEVLATAQTAGLALVIKRHPMCTSPEVSHYLNRVRKLPNVTVSTSSIHKLISNAEAVCVINSGVGSEALLHDKPVYVFGRSDYMAACFICRELGDFARFFTAGKTRLSRHQLERFWYIYRNEYSIDTRDHQAASIRIAEKIEQHLSQFPFTSTGKLST
ncbi:hypothetical protein GR138_29975 [Shinella kummerowiae]|uniref:Capsule biosynthesis protein n=1 Tax=Shinella kummerowiae TaxID=417745 RepID=A0A6N8SK34_9HYPH|nr:hypothetical protein [Shinella kummerowiae]MXN49424.1 hypothetical protein [Shinella kummerowiae]